MKPKKQFYLGIDGGASKTKAVLIDWNRKIIGHGQTGGSNANVFGHKIAVNHLYLATKQAVTKFPTQKVFACFAIAGIDNKDAQQIWEKTILNHRGLSKLLAKPPKVVNDTQAALRSGTTNPNAVVIIAGTGSNCYGRNEKGEEAKSGGVDYILSDEGSGYDVGLKILRSIVHGLDGRGPKTELTKIVFDDFKINSLEDLYKLVYEKPWNKTDIAKIAPLAQIAAENGDRVAGKIIKEAAHDLGLMTKAVVRRLHLQDKTYTIVTAGSLFEIQKTLPNNLQRDVLDFSPKAKFVKPKIDSATAAAYLALEANSMNL